MLFKVILVILSFAKYVSCDLKQVDFVILSQSHPYHANIGEETKSKLEKSLKKNGVEQERNSRNLLRKIFNPFINFSMF